MAFSSLGSVLPSPLPTVRKESLLIIRRDVVRVAEKDSQVVSRNKEAILSGNVSRREAMSYLFGALFSAFIPVEPVEARSTKQENRRKAKEKLEKLREKAGIPKEKKESSSGSKENPPPSPLTRLTTTPLVEATLLTVTNLH